MAVKNEKQYEALKDKGMSKERAARIANSPGASKRGGKSSGSGGSSKQGGTTAQKKAAGRKGGKATANKSSWRWSANAKRAQRQRRTTLKDVPRPDPDEAGEALADAIREPDFRTKTMSPSTSERRLQSDELLGPAEGSQG
jgi:hypothetical protein